MHRSSLHPEGCQYKFSSCIGTRTSSTVEMGVAVESRSDYGLTRVILVTPEYAPYLRMNICHIVASE